MKTKLQLAGLALLLSTLFPQLSTCFAQGSLTPPGAPTPMMKTLDQIEPRLDVTKLTGDANNVFIISSSGSFFLSQNVTGVSNKNGIAILANNVTLDLNGFAVSGVAGSRNGINLPLGETNVAVRNGFIAGWGLNGVNGFSDSDKNILVEKVASSGNGGSGIFNNGQGIIRDCNTQNNAAGGIILNSGGSILSCTISGEGTYGILAELAQVRDCHVSYVNGYGIYSSGSSVINCYVEGCTKRGSYVNVPGSLIEGNNCFGNNSSGSTSDAGIYLNDSNNRIENNHVFASGYAGIQVNTFYLNNVVIKNTVSGNGTNNFLGLTGNDFGPISTAATATSPWANISH